MRLLPKAETTRTLLLIVSNIISAFEFTNGCQILSSLNVEVFVFIHFILSGEQEALCQSHACMLGFVFLLKRGALINLGTRVKKSKIITTSNNCRAICSLQPLQSAILFNPPDNLSRLVPLPPLCRGGNSG